MSFAFFSFSDFFCVIFIFLAVKRHHAAVIPGEKQKMRILQRSPLPGGARGRSLRR